jgi:citrate synthase
MNRRGRITQLTGFSRETGRPRQLYTGLTERDYISLDQR